jgi:AcrR family transcriptional regulator
MPPRDEHEFEQRRQQIIDGALHVFATKGFDKATNKDIAEAAGIGSPGLIYHYFASKDDLLFQVIKHRAPLVPLERHIPALMDMPPREALSLFGRTFVAVVEKREFIAFARLILGEATRRPDLAKMISQVGPGLWLPVISRYLEQQMDAGTLRRMHPGVAARCFVGSLVAYLATTIVFEQPDTLAISGEEMVAGAVDVFLHGMQPDPPTTSD